MFNLIRQAQYENILRTNEESKNYYLVLTKDAANELMDAKEYALRQSGCMGDNIYPKPEQI